MMKLPVMNGAWFVVNSSQTVVKVVISHQLDQSTDGSAHLNDRRRSLAELS